MTTVPKLPEWSELASLDDDALPLLGTALLIARDEYPDLDPADCAQALDEYAETIRATLDPAADATARLVAVNRFLFEELGYAGNHDDYDDPRNSYMNKVLDRRLGIPLSLALVQIEVARRLDLRLDGVSFPGHFLVRMPLPGGIVVIDPFNKGRPVAVSELRERAKPYLDNAEPDDEQLLEILSPASHRSILTRMLRNLKGLYAKEEDWPRLARCCDRLLSLNPGDGKELRDRGLAYLRMGHKLGAREDLELYLRRYGQAPDSEAVRGALIEASGRNVLH